MLFGAGLGHLSYFATMTASVPADPLLARGGRRAERRFPYVVGKSLGRRRLAPLTSPNKTIEGAAGALLLTTAFVSVPRPLHLHRHGGSTIRSTSSRSASSSRSATNWAT